MAVLWRVSKPSKTVALAKSTLKGVYALVHMSDRAFKYELDYQVTLLCANTSLTLLIDRMTRQKICFICGSSTFYFDLRHSN
jgi:hypothetical protein